MSKKHIPNKVYLTESELPRAWYNMCADMPHALAPVYSPQTGAPITPDELMAIFPMSLIEQEVTRERYIDIPEPLQRLLQMFRPSPLTRAYSLEKALDTPARIYYKYEGNNPSGSHKLNSAMAQAFYNKEAGIKRLSTETGAGQWGTALAIAAQYFGLACSVYMVNVSAQQKPYRRAIMQTYGAEVFNSPSAHTQIGRKYLAENPDNPGSLGLAISEAVEDAAGHDDTNYALGSVLNHVVLHQTIIGQEAMTQFEKIDEYPDIIIGCNGGGSNFGGIAYPFLGSELRGGGKRTRFIAVEPSACPKLTRGTFAYDYGDTAGVTPIVKMYTLGHSFMPSGIHAGGLRYHGDSAILSQLYHDGLVEAVAVGQKSVFDAAVLFARQEALLPAPESAHAVRVAIDEALKCKQTGEEKVILFNLSGHGYFDLSAYERYNKGELVDSEYSQADLQQGLSDLPQV